MFAAMGLSYSRCSPGLKRDIIKMSDCDVSKKSGGDGAMTSADFDYVRFTWSDIHGVARCKSVPRRHVTAMLEEGVGIPIECCVFGPSGQLPVIPSMAKAGHGNGTARPAKGAEVPRPLPWASRDSGWKVGEYLCETHALDGAVQAANPRLVARRQLEALACEGFTLVSGYECEFFLERAGGSRLPPFDATNDLTCMALAEMEPLLYTIEHQLHASGIDVLDISIEGSAGQCELAMSPIRGIQSADGVFRLKQAIKEISRQLGYDVTFMSKPRRDVGNGLHFNHSLWTTDGRNVFHDPASGLANGSHAISETCRHWLAGLIEHGPSMTALIAPTVNCYRRFASPHMSPARFDWGMDHRLTSFRVKATSPSATYIENRPPSGSANPYLVLAATVAAGLDGVRRKLECPSPCDPKATRIPTCLEDTLAALEADKVMVEALGQEFIEQFVLTKRGIEMKELEQSNVSNPDDEPGFEAERAMYARFL